MPWVFGLLQRRRDPIGAGGRPNLNAAIDRGRRPRIAQVISALGEGGTVHSYPVVQRRTATGLEIYSIKILAKVSALIATNDNTARMCVETKQFQDLKRSLGQLFQQPAFCVEQIQVVESVPLTLIDKLGRIPRQKGERILWLYIAVVGFRIQDAQSLPRFSIVGCEIATLLGTGHLHYI